jgi:putative CocE/NonD family hydrolase
MTADILYDIVIEKDRMISMRDRVRLACDIYRPSREGQPIGEKLPVLLERTPYGKDRTEKTERAPFFARRGYIVIEQDCRGCFGSEGELYLLANEAEDGYDTIEWIASQPWSNGKVAMYGTSYQSWVQSAAATQNPPHLSCLLPTMSGWNAHTSSVRQGGAVEMRWIAWPFWHAALNNNRGLKKEPWIDNLLNNTDFRQWLTRMPFKKGQTPLSLLPNYERFCLDFLSHADYDDYWKRPGLAIEEYLDGHADVPVYLCGGWYDSYTRATLEMYMALQKTKKSHIKVIMGPWTHGTYNTELSCAGDADLGADAALPSMDEMHLRWFDRWLKDIDNGIDREAPVRIFVMGGGSGRKTKEGHLEHGGYWRDEQEWPLPNAIQNTFYLHGNNTLDISIPEDKHSCTTYRFDPADPVPTIGGNISSLHYLRPPASLAGKAHHDYEVWERREPVCPVGGANQIESAECFGCNPPYMPLSARPDVLVFQTAPLKQNMEVIGPVEVKLWASSSAVDTDFTAKLIDVYPANEDYPQGYALNLTDGIIRARYRSSREKAELMKRGKVYQFTITLYPTGNLFQKGHRIRLDISSSNFPRFDVNPNTGEQIGKSRGLVVADNTIYHDTKYPSCLSIYVVSA